MKYQLLPRLSSLLFVWAILLAWQHAALRFADAALPWFLAALAIPVVMAGAEQAFCRRHAFRNEYLIEPSWLYRLLGLEPLVLVLQLVKSLVLVVLLLAFALLLDLHGWALLLLDVLILSLLMPRLPGLLAGSVQRAYLYALARRLAIRVNTWLLWIESMFILLLGGGGDYRGLSPAEALAFSMRDARMPDAHIQAGGFVDAMIHFQAGAVGLARWAVSVLSRGTDDAAMLVLALLVIGAAALLSWLIARAFSAALIGAMARPMEIWRPRPERRAGGDVFETWWL